MHHPVRWIFACAKLESVGNTTGTPGGSTRQEILDADRSPPPNFPAAPGSRTYFRRSDAPRNPGIGKERKFPPPLSLTRKSWNWVRQSTPERALESLTAPPGARRSATVCWRVGGGVSLTSVILERAAGLQKEWSRPRGPPASSEPSPFASRDIPAPRPTAVTCACWRERGAQAPWSRAEGCLGVGCVPRLLCRAAEESSRDNAPKLSFAAALRRNVLTRSSGRTLSPASTGDRAKAAQGKFSGAPEVA